jgi:hypothetical protein
VPGLGHASAIDYRTASPGEGGQSAQAPSVGRRIRAGFAFENRKRYDPVGLVLHQDIKVGYVVVVKAGAKAVGKINHAKKAGMMVKLNMPLDCLITDLSK